MTNDEIKSIQREMAEQISPFITPLVRNDEDGPTHVGSGGYVDFSGRKLVLTNAHVVSDGHGRLTHKFHDCEEYQQFTQPFCCAPAPHDLAAALVNQEGMSTTCSMMTFPERRMAARHGPVPRELLFLMGFPDSGAYYSPSFSVIQTRAVPYLTQEFEPETEQRDIEHEAYDPAFHFAMGWEPELAEAVDKKNSAMPINAHGFSGSLVLNTRYVEYTTAQKTWNANVAQLTGVVWGWPQQDRVLLATRIEHVRTFLASIS
jgi:hypothetical protein